MDLSGMPMQTDANDLQTPPASNTQTPNQRTGAFGQNMYMGVGSIAILVPRSTILTSYRLTQRQVMAQATRWAS